MHKQQFILFLLVSLIAGVLSACLETGNKNVPDNNEKDTGVHKTFERGPVSVQIDVDKDEITIADRLNLTISVVSDEVYEVTLPGFGEKLEQFGIVDYKTSEPELVASNRLKITRSYVLEPFLSGDYVIPPMKVFFTKKDDVDDTDHEIETEEIIVHVTSLLPDNFEQMALHDIKPPENLPKVYNLWLWAGIPGGVFLLSGILIFVIVRKHKKSGNGIIENKIPAHQQTFDELNALVAENLVEKGDIKGFYQKISDIVRRYIENRFSIKAPEQTTEEFLSGIQARNDFETAYKALLKNFLNHCDLVKFARHQPETEDIQNTFDSSKEFILGTKEEE